MNQRDLKLILFVVTFPLGSVTIGYLLNGIIGGIMSGISAVTICFILMKVTNWRSHRQAMYITSSNKLSFHRRPQDG